MGSGMRSMALALAGSLLFGACGKEDGTAPGSNLAEGTFTATYSGSATGPTTGTANFRVTDGTLYLTLANSTGSRVIEFIGEDTGRLGVGTHTINAAQNTDLYATAVVDGGSFATTLGSVTISASSVSALTGSFNITMETGDGAETVTITGALKANCPTGSCS